MGPKRDKNRAVQLSLLPSGHASSKAGGLVVGSVAFAPDDISSD